MIEEHPDPLRPDAVRAYFELYYWSQQHLWDKQQVLQCFDADLSGRASLLRLQFREAAERYRIIRDEQAPILVPYDATARAIRERLKTGEPADFQLLRAAQLYLVSVHDRQLRILAENQVIVQHDSGLWWLANDDAYSDARGLIFTAVGLGPELLSV